MIAEQSWNLFFDESGRFDDSHDDVVVAGLLVREDVESFWASRLRATLERAVPALPWPLHTWLLYQPSYLVAVGAWLGDEVATERMGEPVAGHVRAAIHLLRLAAPGGLDTAVDSLARGCEPRKDDLDILQSALRTHQPGLFCLLRDDLLLLLATVGRILRVCSSEPHAPVGAVNLVAAGEARRGDARRSSDDDRYLCLLECAVERAASAVAQREGPAHIWVHALTRHVRDPLLGRAVPLHIRHLGPLCTRVRSEVAPERVRVVQASTPRYDADVRGALVLADLVANRSRHCLRHASLAAVHRQLGQKLPGPALTTSTGLSHVACTGEPWDYLHRDGRGERPTGRAWAVTQALQWAPAWRGL